MRLYNTLTKTLETFDIPNDRPVTMYNCGPTVYSYAHIGNFRSFLFADTLRRVLEYNGAKVRQIMNITDVGHLTNDSMEQGIGKLEAESQKTGMSPWDIADHFSEAFHQDRKALGILDAESYPRASDYIQHMQEMISQLIKDEYAYVSDGEVYFDVNKFPRFGCLSGNSLEASNPGCIIRRGWGFRSKQGSAGLETGQSYRYVRINVRTSSWLPRNETKRSAGRSWKMKRRPRPPRHSNRRSPSLRIPSPL